MMSRTKGRNTMLKTKELTESKEAERGKGCGKHRE
jgi:hypothetical protein